MNVLSIVASPRKKGLVSAISQRVLGAPAGLSLRSEQGHVLLGRGLPERALDPPERRDYRQTILPRGAEVAPGEQ